MEKKCPECGSELKPITGITIADPVEGNGDSIVLYKCSNKTCKREPVYTEKLGKEKDIK